jgi:type 1 glutamine amidotransferase
MITAFAGCATLPGAGHRRALIVVGPSRHPAGTHEVAAGGRVMKHLIENMRNVRGMSADVVYEWPDKKLRDNAAVVVFIGDTFPANRFAGPKRNLEELGEMMDRGCGLVCVHYATGLLGEDVTSDGSHPLLGWMGGYFANRSCPHHQSVARVYEAAVVTPASPGHPVSRGWKPFTLHDEPYINNYFGKDGNRLGANVTALATSMLPPESPRPEIVAWGIERAGGGRGFGIVMPHFYKNWRNGDLRRFILNGIVWCAGWEVPAGGVDTQLEDMARFSPEALDYVAPARKK